MPETKKTPSWLLALGKEEPPPEVRLAAGSYGLEHVFKHDFWAYTALYHRREGEGPERIVLKIGRKASFYGLPLGWIGRLHAAHETAVFREVDDLPIVPRFTGRFERHGLSHEYVAGHELRRGERVPDDFFDTLAEGLDEIHRRGLAYVDLEKPENVLVGDEGRPYLFDFQIAWRWPRRWGGELWPIRWLRKRFQLSDHYHLQKLKRRTRPDLMSSAEVESSRKRPLPIRLHGGIVRPFARLRRRILNRLDPNKKHGERGSVEHDEPEARRNEPVSLSLGSGPQEKP